MSEGTEPEKHEHDWLPIPGWYARYRCAECKALGYKSNVTADSKYNPWVQARVLPYHCSVRGCKNPAVMVRRQHPHGMYARGNFCWVHLKKRPEEPAQ